MSWWMAFRSFLHSGSVISLTGGLTATASYIAYKDYMRYKRMLRIYSTGQILPPFNSQDGEICFFKRPGVENDLRRAIGDTFENEYFVINGEIGTGKSRVIIEMVRNMITTDGSQGRGAPIYVLASQGKSFPESLARAVGFGFDEHISGKFFAEFVLGIQALPERDNANKLTRVLNAIEESSFQYLQKYGRPVVLIIDGVEWLSMQMPGALEQIQDKAKLWADTNTVKVVFINNDEVTIDRLEKNSSSWARAAVPINISDLSREEALQFLMATPFMNGHQDGARETGMSEAKAQKIVHLVGGRIVHLVACKRDFFNGIPFEKTESNLRSREQEKFIVVSQTESLWSIISTVREARGKCYKLSKLIKSSSVEKVNLLVKYDILRYVREHVGVLVKFQSPLTEQVVDEYQRAYLRSKEKERQKLQNGNNTGNAQNCATPFITRISPEV